MAQQSNKLGFRGRRITISCTDIDASEAFYRDLLGAELIPDDGFGCRWYELGDLELDMMPTAEKRSSARHPHDAMPMLCLEVDDIHEAHDWLLRNQVQIIEEPDETDSMLVADPDGLLITIWHSESDH